MHYSHIAIAALLICASTASAQSQVASSKPKPDRIESLDRQARIFGRLLEKKLNITPGMTALGDGSAARVFGEQPPEDINHEGHAVLRSLGYLQTPRSDTRAITCEVQTAAIPGIGAMMWVECGIPTTAVTRKSGSGDAKFVLNEWEQAQREIESAGFKTKSAAGIASTLPEPTELILNPNAEAWLTKVIEGIATQHAARLEALEADEAIVIVLRLKPQGGLQDYLDHSAPNAFGMLSQNANGNTAAPRMPQATQQLTTAVPEVVVVLRCPRVPDDGTAPTLQRVTRYQVR